MCCEFGKGNYIGYLDGVEAFSSPEDDEEEWEVRSHPFTIEAKEVEVEETPGEVKVGDEICITNYIMDRREFCLSCAVLVSLFDISLMLILFLFFFFQLINNRLY